MANENKGQNNNPRYKRCVRCEYTSIQEPTQTPDDGLVPVNVLSWSPENYEKVQNDPDNYKVSSIPTTYSRGSIIIGSMTGQNLYSQLQIFAKAFPGIEGPNHVETRDNKITIHNGKTNGNPKFAYTYAGGTGELLEFSITTKYTQTIASNKKTSIDPDDKSVNTEVDQCIPTEEENPCQYDMLTRDWSKKKGLINPVDALYMAKVRHGLTTTPKASCQQNEPPKRTIYNSQEEAKTSLANGAVLTEQEVAQFNAIMKKKYEALINPKTGEDYLLLLHQSGNLEDLIIKRKVMVYVDPKTYAAESSRGRVRSSQTPTVTSGGVMPRNSTNTDNINWRRGYQVLKKDKEKTIVYQSSPYRVGDKVLVEMEVEIPVPGVRVMSSPNFISMGQAPLNDVVNSITNQVKANAKFVGNPSMESSQNMEIHHISNRYSGIWYSKEVTHTLDHSGYFTEVVFNKKTQNVLVNKISAKVNTQSIFKETQQIAEESYRTGAWKYPTEIAAAVKKYREDSWRKTNQPASSDGRQIWAEQNPEAANKWTIYEADKDFETGTSMKKPVKDVTL